MFESNVSGFPVHRGKVRDIYAIGSTMLIIVTTDRISAFDYVFPDTVIPNKGKILTQLSLYWADQLDVYYHMITNDLTQMPDCFRKPEFAGRTMMVEKANVIPYECVVRGYLSGSAWQEYQQNGTICGEVLPRGLRENSPFPAPKFTPAIKVQNGHDENVSFNHMADHLGLEVASDIEQQSIGLYLQAAEHAWENGIIIADTKFEWGFVNNNDLVLIDEILTPDSSRFWPVGSYCIGQSVASFDKQFVRDWLTASSWDKQSKPPPLPTEIIEKTAQKYMEAFMSITGKNELE